jgi:hypothetical protein
MSGISGSPAADRLRLWSAGLFQELLPTQDEPGMPVLLACDDETIRVVADRLGLESIDPSIQFGRDIAVAFQVGKLSGWKTVVGGAWENASRPRPLPAFFPVLCLWVLAATRMAPDEKHPTSEYHGRLCYLLGVSGDDSLPCFNFIGSRFHDLAAWLEHDVAGRHGHLIVPTSPHPEHVGFAVEQTVFRLRDRQILSVFFTERLRGSLDGFDPLRRLQRWSGRGQLTGHAQRILENPQFEDRVRAAVRIAFRSWDGAELVETANGGLGRFWPASIRLLVYPHPRLQLGAAHPKAIELTLTGDSVMLEPMRELELPWGLVTRAAARSVDLGNPLSPAGGVRLPRLGETLIFENGEAGLLRVEQPAAERVWVLTHDGALQVRLGGRKFNDGGALPVGWELFFEVPVDELPGVERAPVPMPHQTPLRLEGGLSLGRLRYLSGYEPYLVAGDLETDAHLGVMVDGEEFGHIWSGGRIPLPAEPGRHEVEVGDGEFKTSYDIEEKGEPSELQLCHHLGSQRPLRVGARPPGTACDGTTVCGAAVSPTYDGDLPLLTRVLTDVETICASGALIAHKRPSTPSWFKEVGLHERGRWELFCDEPVWLLMPPAGGQPRVRLLRDVEVTRLDAEAARRVVDVGLDIDFQRSAVDAATTRARWEAMLAVARSSLGGDIAA